MKSLLYLIKQGFDVDETTPGVPNPLITAVLDGSYDMVKVLLENGADPSVVGEQTPVSIATKQKNTKILSLLLEHDAPPSPFFTKAVPPLLIAVKNEDRDAQCELISKGANPNVFQESKQKKKKIYPLAHAVNEKNFQAILLLMFAGCNTKYACTPADKLDPISEQIVIDIQNFKYKPVEKQKFPFWETIEKLEKEKEKIKKRLEDISKQLLPTEEMSQLRFAPSMTAARQGYKLFIPYVEKLIDFTSQLQKEREPLLAEQVEYYKKLIATRNIRTANFMQFIPPENNTREHLTGNMEKLYQLAYTLEQFDIILVHTYNMIQSYHEETKKYIDYAFIEISCVEEKITKLSTSPTLLVRAGLPKPQLDCYKQNAPSRIDQLRETRGQLDNLWTQCTDLVKELLKSIRQCYK